MHNGAGLYFHFGRLKVFDHTRSRNGSQKTLPPTGSGPLALLGAASAVPGIPLGAGIEAPALKLFASPASR